MPLHDVGYRRWNGSARGFGGRWWAITNKGFEIALRSYIVRRMIFLAWLPALYFGAGFFLFEKFVETNTTLKQVQAANDIVEGVVEGFEKGLGEKGIDIELTARTPQALQERRDQARQAVNRSWLGGIIRSLGGDGSQNVLDALTNPDEGQRRKTVWSWMILQFIRVPQGLALLLLVGWVAPPLIAKDLRTKAFLLYFSRPLSKLSYILGKLMILVVLAGFITTLPACLLYFVGIGLSPNLDSLFQTWDLPFRIVLVSMVHIIPACLLALMFSSLTTESRYAMFSWYATWILGFVSWQAIRGAFLYGGPRTRDTEIALNEGGAWMYLSLYDTIASAQSWTIGVSDDYSHSLPAFIILVALSLFCFSVIWWRISKAVLI